MVWPCTGHAAHARQNSAKRRIHGVAQKRCHSIIAMGQKEKENLETSGKALPGRERLGIVTRVRITGGVHHRKGYSGVVMGVTRCFTMDVKVAGQPVRILRVWKISIQEEAGLNTEQMVESVQSWMRVADILEAEPEVSEMLLKVCMQLMEHRVAPGEAGVHVVLDASLEVVQQMWKAMRREDNKK
jgi:hypothetical protein